MSVLFWIVILAIIIPASIGAITYFPENLEPDTIREWIRNIINWWLG